MAREATITQDQVSAAANTIKVGGGKPTSRAIREVLGCGSMGTILKFLQIWQGGQIRQSEAIDDTLDPAVARAISNQIVTKVQEATAEATTRLVDLQMETDSVIAENERQAAEIEAQVFEISTIQEQHAALIGRLQQMETDAIRIAAELVAERKAAESARIALARAELRLEAVPRIETEIEQVRMELTQANKYASEQHEVAAVAIVRQQSADTIIASMGAQLTEQKQSSELLLARANAMIAAAEAEAKKSASEAAELRGKLSVKPLPKSKTTKTINPKPV